MTTGESITIIGGVISAASSIYFPWRQNKIFERQNAIFSAQAAQGGVVVAPDTTQHKLSRYWPMIVMLFLAVAMWGAVGFDYYDRHSTRIPDHFDISKMQVVDGEHFLNQAVDLDNKEFRDCTFENVSFVYHGTGNVFIKNRPSQDSPLKGNITLRTTSAAAEIYRMIQATLVRAQLLRTYKLTFLDAQGKQAPPIEQLVLPPFLKLANGQVTTSAYTPNDLAVWSAYKLTNVRDQTFHSEVVEVDGQRFIDCSFDNATLVVEGTAPFDFEGIKQARNVVLQSPLPALVTMAKNVAALQHLADDSKGTIQFSVH
jgi:hypothetical protein